MNRLEMPFQGVLIAQNFFAKVALNRHKIGHVSMYSPDVLFQCRLRRLLLPTLVTSYNVPEVFDSPHSALWFSLHLEDTGLGQDHLKTVSDINNLTKSRWKKIKRVRCNGTNSIDDQNEEQLGSQTY